MKTALIGVAGTLLGIIIGASIDYQKEYLKQIGNITKECGCKDYQVCIRNINIFKKSIGEEDCDEYYLEKLVGKTMVVGQALDLNNNPVSNAIIRVKFGETGKEKTKSLKSASNGFFFFDIEDKYFSRVLSIEINHKDYKKLTPSVIIKKYEINTPNIPQLENS